MISETYYHVSNKNSIMAMIYANIYDKVSTVDSVTHQKTMHNII